MGCVKSQTGLNCLHDASGSAFLFSKEGGVWQTILTKPSPS